MRKSHRKQEDQCVHMKLIRNKKKQSAIKSTWNILSDYMREEGGKRNKKGIIKPIKINGRSKAVLIGSRAKMSFI